MPRDIGLRRRRTNSLAEKISALEYEAFSNKAVALRRISLDVTIAKIADLTAGVINIIGTGETAGNRIIIDADHASASIETGNFAEDSSSFVEEGFILRSTGGVEIADLSVKDLRLDIPNNYLISGRGKGRIVEYKPLIDEGSDVATSFTAQSIDSIQSLSVDDRIILTYPENNGLFIASTDEDFITITNALSALSIEASITSHNDEVVVSLKRHTADPNGTNGTTIASVTLNSSNSYQDTISSGDLTDIPASTRIWLEVDSDCEILTASLSLDGDSIISSFRVGYTGSNPSTEAPGDIIPFSNGPTNAEIGQDDSNEFWITNVALSSLDVEFIIRGDTSINFSLRRSTSDPSDTNLGTVIDTGIVTAGFVSDSISLSTPIPVGTRFWFRVDSGSGDLTNKFIRLDGDTLATNYLVGSDSSTDSIDVAANTRIPFVLESNTALVVNSDDYLVVAEEIQSATLTLIVFSDSDDTTITTRDGTTSIDTFDLDTTNSHYNLVEISLTDLEVGTQLSVESSAAVTILFKHVRFEGLLQPDFTEGVMTGGVVGDIVKRTERGYRWGRGLPDSMDDGYLAVGEGLRNPVGYKPAFTILETVTNNFDSGVHTDSTEISTRDPAMADITITDIISTDDTIANVSEVYTIERHLDSLRIRGEFRTTAGHTINLYYRDDTDPTSRTNGTELVDEVGVLDTDLNLYVSLIDATIGDVPENRRYWFNYSGTENHRFSSIQMSGFYYTTEVDEEGAISGFKIDYIQNTEPPSSAPPYTLWIDTS